MEAVTVPLTGSLAASDDAHTCVFWYFGQLSDTISGVIGLFLLLLIDSILCSEVCEIRP